MKHTRKQTVLDREALVALIVDLETYLTHKPKTSGIHLTLLWARLDAMRKVKHLLDRSIEEFDDTQTKTK